jgi:hypothetical protein
VSSNFKRRVVCGILIGVLAMHLLVILGTMSLNASSRSRVSLRVLSPGEWGYQRVGCCPVGPHVEVKKMGVIAVDIHHDGL